MSKLDTNRKINGVYTQLLFQKDPDFSNTTHGIQSEDNSVGRFWRDSFSVA
jgi:hypothetical protein